MIGDQEQIRHHRSEKYARRSSAYRQAIKIIDDLNNPMVDAENMIDDDGEDPIFTRLFNLIDQLGNIAHEGLWEIEEREQEREDR